MVNTAVTLCGLPLENPIIPASGTFSYGYEFAQIYDINCLGTFSFKGTTLAPRYGNPTPRIAEYAGGLLNSVGLQNPGVDAFIAEELPFLRQYDVKVIANISGNTPEEYGVMCEKLAGAGVDMIEVNISCPNVKAGGLAYGTRPELAAEVTEMAKSHAGNVPVMVKLSPNVTDITEIARAVEAAGADAVSLINTIRGMRIDVNTRRPILKMNTGGLSGPAVLRGGVDGLGGVPGGQGARAGYGRRQQRGGRGPADAGRSLRRGGGHRPVCRPLRPDQGAGRFGGHRRPTGPGGCLRAHRRRVPLVNLPGPRPGVLGGTVMLEELIGLILPPIISICELMGIFVVSLSALQAFWNYCKGLVTNVPLDVKFDLANGLATSLEFKMAAEILKTVLVRDLNELVVLGAVVLLRALLSLLIHFEMKSHR